MGWRHCPLGGYSTPNAARREAETLMERPAFGVERPLSNARRIRGSPGRDVPIERRRRDAEAVRDLGDADVGVGQHRLGSLDVVIGKFWRSASGAASTPGGGEADLGALADQAALEFCQYAEHVKDQPPLRGRCIEASVRLQNPIPLSRRFSTVSINCFIDRANRSSFHTMSVSPLRANSSA
jgi:hypothetical protein